MSFSIDQVQPFINRWLGTKGGAERANYQWFLNDFAEIIDAPRVEKPADGGLLSNYQFDGPVSGGAMSGGTGFVDLYKRDCFILEAKQSKLPASKSTQAELYDVPDTAPSGPSGARYDRFMTEALKQARNYALHLPSSHSSPPFLIVCDIGRAFELYFDWSGNGRGYSFFPNKASYRYTLDQFADPEVRALFRDIWVEPTRRDPRAKAAEVTSDVAKRLADVSRWLEATQLQKTTQLSSKERSLAIEDTALFLMRLLFCMFAEDVGLLPENSFEEFLEDSLDDDHHFQTGLADLWHKMGVPHLSNRWSWVTKSHVRYFNGGLFANAKTYGLGQADRGELLAAARYDWTKVEPAIFGTLLEQALTSSERSKLGAHYTPRPYVERLVQATIMDVLDAEWSEVKQSVQDGLETASGQEQCQVVDQTTPVLEFLARLQSVRVLDPACGTGNFLYVAMEALLRLEGQVIELLAQLGASSVAQVGPHQFFGLELNPRAAVIAELVLWIGWLRWRTANDATALTDPVLRRTNTINFGGHAGYDAVLRRSATGDPDVDAPLAPIWPEADFIIGNPPFIGKGSAMRGTLGSEYVEALWAANPNVPHSADFVMFWWDRAATIVASGEARRFGFVATNSISGTFNRRVIERHTSKVSLVFAIPDHPWTKAATDAAAVRISMTVGERGVHEGQLHTVVSEAYLDTDNPQIISSNSDGLINSNLTIGADVTGTSALRANEGLSCNGMMLAGQGFKITRDDATHLINQDAGNSHEVIRPYLAGSELVRRSLDNFVIDFAGLDEAAARLSYPAAYQHLLDSVKPGRDANLDRAFRERWWLFGRTRPELRAANADLGRYIATTETTKHRIFQFLDANVLPDHMIIAIGSDSAFHLGVLSSSQHISWTFANCAMLGVATLEQGHRYTKSRIFDSFPFPDATSHQQTAIAELAEELDTMRKGALAATPGLTMTEIYNLRSLKLSGASLSPALKDRAARAQAGIVNRLHDQIDAEVAKAYGWPNDLTASQIVSRLVALNTLRAREEKVGTVRWLRPQYQKSRLKVEDELSRVVRRQTNPASPSPSSLPAIQ